MIHPDGIEVFLKSVARDDAYHEYQLPTPGASSKNEFSECYIEAVEGEEFAVVIKLHPHFKSYHAHSLNVGVHIDNWGRIGALHEISSWNDNGTESKVVEVMSETLCRIGDTWAKVKLAFGKLDIDDESFLDNETLENEAERVGTIAVDICRVRREKESTPATPLLLRSVEGVAAKQLVKGRGITHSAKPIVVMQIAQPTLARSTKRIRGKHGNTLTFKIRYRSNMSLQLLGIVPLSATNQPIEHHSISNSSGERQPTIDIASAVVPLPNSDPPGTEISTMLATPSPKIKREACPGSLPGPSSRKKVKIDPSLKHETTSLDSVPSDQSRALSSPSQPITIDLTGSEDEDFPARNMSAIRGQQETQREELDEDSEELQDKLREIQIRRALRRVKKEKAQARAF
ncbi:hypothetical protein AOQ84DRAFT_371753 [Glonium stellatum]|uniref:DUF7918 domain-containing protein n=1 Tax=Glonium stellatum TaxID=574774 RepID=A0A8E2FB34_9PEZI|nr:hypothetical protein AOQ84DRAFT_371753 [Glonium stellatum]